jgi:hypothetical protein
LIVTSNYSNWNQQERAETKTSSLQERSHFSIDPAPDLVPGRVFPCSAALPAVFFYFVYFYFFISHLYFGSSPSSPRARPALCPRSTQVG